jgi:hypothetical protein
LSFLDGVEVIDHAADPFSEVVDSAVDLVPAGQSRALFGEAGSFRLEFAVAGGDGSGPSLQPRQLDQPGLVEVDQSTLSASAASTLLSSPGEFASEQFVVADPCGGGEGVFHREQQVRLQQCLLTGRTPTHQVRPRGCSVRGSGVPDRLHAAVLP